MFPRLSNVFSLKPQLPLGLLLQWQRVDASPAAQWRRVEPWSDAAQEMLRTKTSLEKPDEATTGTVPPHTAEELLRTSSLEKLDKATTGTVPPHAAQKLLRTKTSLEKPDEATTRTTPPRQAHESTVGPQTETDAASWGGSGVGIADLILSREVVEPENHLPHKMISANLNPLGTMTNIPDAPSRITTTEPRQSPSPRCSRSSPCPP
ncbi:hypothetical protein BJ875DRAFT_489117 [Amylocarpus encephaloides]|uniref:Uncharacterized protein n=1 Tax=Amylocarpus encephaloides TaxID=45428 RepID=A0A9P7Y9A7_9HELO|nr:hypothetical protein BJ875DRAFT_489117 [Amylocarpus encephaloides]